MYYTYKVNSNASEIGQMEIECAQRIMPYLSPVEKIRTHQIKLLYLGQKNSIWFLVIGRLQNRCGDASSSFLPT